MRNIIVLTHRRNRKRYSQNRIIRSKRGNVINKTRSTKTKKGSLILKECEAEIETPGCRAWVQWEHLNPSFNNAEFSVQSLPEIHDKTSFYKRNNVPFAASIELFPCTWSKQIGKPLLNKTERRIKTQRNWQVEVWAKRKNNWGVLGKILYSTTYKRLIFRYFLLPTS